MHLKNQVEWTLHCCVLLAFLPPDKYLSTKDLAEFHGVPKEYLSKALQGLSQASLVLATLGPQGGYRLAKLPEDISFLDIVEAVEGKMSTFNCSDIRLNNPCLTRRTKLTKPCGIARVMWEADEAWRSHLRSVYLSDVISGMQVELPADLLEKSATWINNHT